MDTEPWVKIRVAFNEAMRLVQVSERILAVAEHLRATLTSIDRIEEVAPDLYPEMGEARTRLLELTDHIQAAGEVVVAKIDLLGEGLGS